MEELTEINETSTEINDTQMVLQKNILSEETNDKFCEYEFVNDKSLESTQTNTSEFWHAHVYHRKIKLTSFFIADIIGETLNQNKDHPPISLTTLIQAAKKTTVTNLENTEKDTNDPSVPNAVNEPLNLTTKIDKKKILHQKGKICIISV